MEVQSISFGIVLKADGNKNQTNPQKLINGETIKTIEGIPIANQGKTRGNPIILLQNIPVKLKKNLSILTILPN
jgi:hypothetical protein